MRYDYSEAMLLVRSGERVRRASWPAAWLYLAEGGPPEGPDRIYLVERHPGEEDEKASEFVARNAELMASDWVVVGAAPTPEPSADVPPPAADASADGGNSPPAETETGAEKPE